MEGILALGAIGLIFLFFRKIIYFIINIFLMAVGGFILAILTKATLTTGVFTAFCIVISFNLVYKYLFKSFKKLLTSSKRYQGGFLEKIVDILFSINKTLSSTLWFVAILHICKYYSFDMILLFKSAIYAGVSIMIFSLFERTLVKRI